MRIDFEEIFPETNMDMMVNIHARGDEVATNLRSAAQAAFAAGALPADLSNLIPSVTVSRTGYREIDLPDYEAESKKADWGVYYRPFADDLEFSYVGKWGTGQTVYQAATDMQLKNLMTQHKLEAKNNTPYLELCCRNMMLGSHTHDLASWNINMSMEDDIISGLEHMQELWIATLNGATDEAAYAGKSLQFNEGRFLPGTAEFEEAKATVLANPDFATGSKFRDNLNFITVTLITISVICGTGQMFRWVVPSRQYDLNSQGSIYADADAPPFTLNSVLILSL